MFTPETHAREEQREQDAHMHPGPTTVLRNRRKSIRLSESVEVIEQYVEELVKPTTLRQVSCNVIQID